MSDNDTKAPAVKNLHDALERVSEIRRNDSTLPEERRIAAKQARFDLQRAAIASGVAHLVNLNHLSGEQTAYEAVGEMVDLLRVNKATAEMLNLAAAFVRSNPPTLIEFVANAIESDKRSKHVLDLVADYLEAQDAAACHTILCLPSLAANRPRKDYERSMMVNAYDLALAKGESYAAAEIAAYNAHGHGWNFALDDDKKDKLRGEYAVKKSVAHVRMIDEVRPLLRSAGCDVPKRQSSGRRPKK